MSSNNRIIAIVVIIVLLVGVAFVFLFSFDRAGAPTESSTTTTEEDLSFIGTTWVLDTASEMPAEITLQFDGENVSGSSGCNTYRARYTTSPADGNAEYITIVSNTMITTKMACSDEIMKLEKLYLDTLPTASLYTISGDTLTMNSMIGLLTYKGSPVE